MKTDSTLTTFESWTLRVRPGSSKQILLLLHGWTGDENSMSIFTANFPAEYWIVSPRAPYAAVQGGYSWRMPAPRGSWPNIGLLRPSVDGLIDLVSRWAPVNDLDSSSVDVVGFSQGGAMAFSVGVLYPEKVRKLGILAGFAPEGSEDFLTPDRLVGKRIFFAHGTLDEMVPIAMAKQAIRLVEDAGGEVIYCESEIGHKLSAACLGALNYYLAN